MGAVRRTLEVLLRGPSRYGIQPAESWPGKEPWTAPTAWTAWALAAAGQRREALELVGALRRAATPAGTLPERVDEESGVARSTTPLGWSHAFAVLALGALFPSP
jgi:GH15 family glucan-1,4-alpha-glucosidase